MKRIVFLTALTFLVISNQIQFTPFQFENPFLNTFKFENDNMGIRFITFNYNPDEQPFPNPVPAPNFCCNQQFPSPFLIPPSPEMQFPFSGNPMIHNSLFLSPLMTPPFQPAPIQVETPFEQETQPIEAPQEQSSDMEIPAAEAQQNEETTYSQTPTQINTFEPLSYVSFMVDPSLTPTSETPTSQPEQTPVLKVSEPSAIISQVKSQPTLSPDSDSDDDDTYIPPWLVFIIFVSAFLSIVLISKVVQKVKERRRQQFQYGYGNYGNYGNYQPNLAASLPQQIQYHYAEAKRLEGLLQEQQRLQYENSQGPIGYINTSQNEYTLPRPDNPINAGYGRVV